MLAPVIKSAELKCSDLSELHLVAQKIVDFAGDLKVWIFEGEMGAGKTTLIKAISEFFSVEDNVTSPTFSIINEYQSGSGDIFYHFDFYRIKDEAEAMDIGVEEYFYSDNYCFIEWPSKIPNLIPENFLKISIVIQDRQTRIIQLFRNEI